MLFAVLAAIALTASPAVGAARTPCWQLLVRDWSDGRIDSAYPTSCYRQALARLPEDLQVYSSAPDDLRAALQHRVGAESGSRSLAVHSTPLGSTSSSGWSEALPIVGLGGAGSLLLAGALGFVARSTRRRRAG
jgi:hypothetical protein